MSTSVFRKFPVNLEGETEVTLPNNYVVIGLGHDGENFVAFVDCGLESDHKIKVRFKLVECEEEYDDSDWDYADHMTVKGDAIFLLERYVEDSCDYGSVEDECGDNDIPF